MWGGREGREGQRKAEGSGRKLDGADLRTDDGEKTMVGKKRHEDDKGLKKEETNWWEARNGQAEGGRR